jgi:excisionase family DNA binding protein
MSTLSGWKQATNYVGHGTSTMRIRRAVERGELRATKTGSVYTFDTDDLDAFKMSLTAIAGGSEPPSTAPVQLTTPPAPSSSTSAIAQSGVITPFLLAAVAARESARVGSAAAGDDDREGDDTIGDETSYHPPFWAASAAPMYPEGEPVVDPLTRMISYRPAGSSTSPGGAHSPGTVGSLIAELQAQLATMQAQLAATTAAAEQWRAAWRAARAAAIAHAIMNEATNAGASPASVDAA